MYFLMQHIFTRLRKTLKGKFEMKLGGYPS